jgi:DNA-binding transcriptional regulator YhcF (GntR family)
MLKLVLSRESSVPLRAQLALQIEVAIVTGQLEPGRKLPSVRELARRLELHHNTVAAAYADLTERKLIRARRGSGLFVSARSRAKSPDEAKGLDELIASFVEIALARGHDEASIRDAMRAWVERRPCDHILIVEPADDIRLIMEHEISSALASRVESAGFEALDDPASLDGALLVASFYHSARIRERLGPSAPLVTISLNPGRAEFASLDAMPEGAILGMISVSPILLAMIATVVSSFRGEEILVRTVHLSEESEWQKLARTADAIVCDSLSGARVAPFARRGVRIVQLVPESTIEQLRERLRG